MQIHWIKKVMIMCSMFWQQFCKFIVLNHWGEFFWNDFWKSIKSIHFFIRGKTKIYWFFYSKSVIFFFYFYSLLILNLNFTECIFVFSSDVLAFLTGQEEIETACKKVQEASRFLTGGLIVLPLYAGLPPSAQMRIFEPANSPVRF